MQVAWRNLSDGVAAQALRAPASPALLAGRTALSYARLAELIQRCAVHLAALGVQPGEVAAVALPTGVPAIVLTLGLLRLGAIPLPLAPDAGAEAASAAHLFCGPREAEVAGPRCHHVGPEWLGAADARRGDVRLARPADAVHLLNPVRPGEAGPLAVEVTLRQMLARVAAALALFPAIYDPARPARLILPPGMPLAAALLFALPQIACGGPLLLPAGSLAAALAETEDAACPLSAPACRRLLADAAAGPRFGRLRGLMVATQGLEPGFAATIAEGLTPHVSHFLADPAGGFLLAAAAAEPLRPPPGLWAEVSDGQGRMLPPGQPGHLRLRGMAVSHALHRQPAAAAALGLRGGWLAPGDLAEAAADGGITLLGPTCDVASRRGAEVFTLAVERALAGHPAVAAVAAVRARTSAQAVAFIVPDGPSAPEALRRHIASRVPAAGAPDRVQFLRALPRTTAGAVDRVRLSVMADIETVSGQKTTDSRA